MTTPEITASVREFIKKNFIFDDKKSFSDSESLIGTGIVDSTGILELINFLEESFSLRFEDDDLVGENFDSVEKIAGFVSKKKMQN